MCVHVRIEVKGATTLIKYVLFESRRAREHSAASGSPQAGASTSADPFAPANDGSAHNPIELETEEDTDTDRIFAS